MFHTHKWQVVSTGRYTRSSVFTRDFGGSDVTLVLKKCLKCGAHKTIELEGHWTKEALS